MDYQDSLSTSTEILEKLSIYLEESLLFLQVTKREGYYLGIFFPILEYSEELLTLLKYNKTTILPIVCRTIIEKTIDIEILTVDSTYMDRLEMNTLKRGDKISEFILKRKVSFDNKGVNREKSTRRYIKERLTKFKKSGVKPISGLLNKFKISMISEDPVMYWALDKMSQEVHTDIRNIFHKYQNLDLDTRSINKAYLKPKRNEMNTSDKSMYLMLIMESVLFSSRCVLDKFELQYKRSIEFQLEEIEKLRLCYSDSINR